MKQGLFKITENEMIAKNTMKMVLKGEGTEELKAGQFINIKLDGFYLRRPISICDFDHESITIIYKIVGQGTEAMSKLEKGEMLDCLTGLGNGYELKKAGKKPLLIGGGAGVPPMYRLAKELINDENVEKVSVILGFNTEEEVFFKEEFEALGVDLIIATADGSLGVKGFVSDAMKTVDYGYFYTCGPMPMFKAIEAIAETSGQYSFEERMGCGFGACMGCSCETKYGYKRICKDGPVLEREEIIW